MQRSKEQPRQVRTRQPAARCAVIRQPPRARDAGFKIGTACAEVGPRWAGGGRARFTSSRPFGAVPPPANRADLHGAGGAPVPLPPPPPQLLPRRRAGSDSSQPVISRIVRSGGHRVPGGKARQATWRVGYTPHPAAPPPRRRPLAYRSYHSVSTAAYPSQEQRPEDGRQPCTPQKVADRGIYYFSRRSSAVNRPMLLPLSGWLTDKVVVYGSDNLAIACSTKATLNGSRLADVRAAQSQRKLLQTKSDYIPTSICLLIFRNIRM